MQTSLARRERRRRLSKGRHTAGGTRAASRIAIILPLILLASMTLLAGVVFVGAVDAYAYYAQDLPDPKAALDPANLKMSQPTVILDRTGTVQLAKFGTENRKVLKFEDFPASIIDATTSAEDKTFWTNTGFDPAAVLSAFRDALEGRPRGASTITQQLVRQVMLPPTNSTADRKVKEIIQSMRLTQAYPGKTGKQQIMTAFLNYEFYGYQSYGIAAAAERYFGVSDIRQVSVAQAAVLASILRAPTTYDLMANAQEQDDGTLIVPAGSEIVARRNWVLGEMIQNLQDGLLVGTYDISQLQAARNEPVVLHPPEASPMIAPHFSLQVREQLARLLCGPDVPVGQCDRVDTGGYRVTTTVDLKMQQIAEKYVKAYAIGSNQTSVSAMQTYLNGLGISSKSTTASKVRAVLGKNVHNAALIAVDYRTGQVLAYVGSAGFYEKPVKNPKKPNQNVLDPQFDVLSDGWRQPGSSFKPINYITAVDKHTLTASSLIMDVGTDFGGGYAPHDADNLERGPLRVRNALQFSLNIPAVRAAYISGVPAIMQKAKDFGITFPPGVTPGVSIGVGTVEVHPADLASAYGAIANQGVLMDRTMILEIKDHDGKVVWPVSGARPTGTRSASAQASYVITDILAGNTDPKENFWWGQYKVMDGSKRRPATLKTGTSDNTEDLFALGYVAPPKDPNAPAIVVGVWAGNSDRSAPKPTMSLEFTAPLWHDFIAEATAGTPITDFPQPTGLTWKDVDANTGMLPGPFTTKTVKEVFINGTVPTQVDNTKVPVDVDSVTNTLWVDGCPGVKTTKGFLDLSKVDAGNALFQKYDQIWISRARGGIGKRGGPAGGMTWYFYNKQWHPYGTTWGAPFAPSTVCTIGPPPTPTPGPTDSGGPGPTPTPPGPTPTPAPHKTPKP